MDSTSDALLKLLGGRNNPTRRREVADAAGVSEQYLYQVATQRAMPSKKPRAIGREVRERLNAAFPGWDTQSPMDTVRPQTTPLRINSDQAAEAIVDALAGLAPTRWASIRAQLDLLSTNPEMHNDIVTELKQLLAQTTKLRRAA